MNRVTVAVRGSGSIGSRHIEVLRGLGHSVIAVPVRTDRQVELREQGVQTAQSLSSARAAGATHAVIATNTGRHLADATEAVYAGLHVLVEKPLASTDEGIDELANAALRAGRSVHVAFCLRFDQSLGAFRAQLPAVGAIHHVTIACQSYLPSWRPGRDHRTSYSASPVEGGVLRDLSHEIDYARWLFGRPNGPISALLANTGRLGIEAEDAASLAWRLEGGATLQMRLDYTTLHARRSILVQGSLGELEWNGIATTVRLRLGDEPESLTRYATSRNAMYEEQAKAFLSESPGETLCTLAEARAVVLHSDAARRSSEQERQMPVGEPL